MEKRGGDLRAEADQARADSEYDLVEVPDLMEVPDLVEDLTTTWASLTRHCGATLVSDVASDVPRRIRLDRDELRRATARAMVRVLEILTVQTVVHASYLATTDSSVPSGNLTSLRCRITAISADGGPTTGDTGPGAAFPGTEMEAIEEFSVPAAAYEEVSQRQPAREVDALDGARILQLAPSRDGDLPPDASAVCRSLMEVGAAVHMANSASDPVDLLLEAADANRPFDLCVLHIDEGSDMERVVKAIRVLPAFSGLPVLLVAGASTISSPDGDVMQTESDPHTAIGERDEVLECARALLVGAGVSDA